MLLRLLQQQMLSLTRSPVCVLLDAFLSVSVSAIIMTVNMMLVVQGVLIWHSSKTMEILKALLLQQAADSEVVSAPPQQQHSPVQAGRRQAVELMLPPLLRVTMCSGPTIMSAALDCMYHQP